MMVAMTLNYTYRAEWDPERLEYFARCLEFPGRYAEAFTAHEAIAALEIIITDALAEMAEYGQTAPDSLTDHRYSGRFLIPHVAVTARQAQRRGLRAAGLVQPVGGRQARRSPAHFRTRRPLRVEVLALQLCDCRNQVRKLLPIGVNLFETTSGACRVGQHEVFQTVISIAADSVENLLAVAAEN